MVVGGHKGGPSQLEVNGPSWARIPASCSVGTQTEATPLTSKSAVAITESIGVLESILSLQQNQLLKRLDRQDDILARLLISKRRPTVGPTASASDIELDANIVRSVPTNFKMRCVTPGGTTNPLIFVPPVANGNSEHEPMEPEPAAPADPLVATIGAPRPSQELPARSSCQELPVIMVSGMTMESEQLGSEDELPQQLPEQFARRSSPDLSSLTIPDMLLDQQNSGSSSTNMQDMVGRMANPWYSSGEEDTKNASPSFLKTKSDEDDDLKAAAFHRQGSSMSSPDDDEDQLNHPRHVKTADELRASTYWRDRVRWLVSHVRFELFFAIAIVTNAVFIGVEVQYNVDNPGPKPDAYRIIGQLYTFIFIIELSMRILASGCDIFFMESWAWNVLDCVIIACSLWETLVEILYVAYDGSNGRIDVGGSSGVTSLRVIRIVRMTRLVRVTKIARIMRFIKALRTLVASIICTLKSLVWAMVLLFLITYVFGILFTQAVADYIQDPNHEDTSENGMRVFTRYWGGLAPSMLTLFMSICGGVSWEIPMAPLQEISPAWSILFLFFISFAYFAVLNVVTGVFCQSAIESAQNDHDMIMHSIVTEKEAHIAKVKSLFKDIDGDQSGYITFHELESNMHKPSVQTYFEALELNVDDAWNFFKLLDEDGGSSIEIEEFLMGCLRLRGNAKALDLAKMHHDQQWMLRKQSAFMAHVEKQLGKLGQHVGQLEIRSDLSMAGFNSEDPSMSSMELPGARPSSKDLLLVPSSGVRFAIPCEDAEMPAEIPASSHKKSFRTFSAQIEAQL